MKFSELKALYNEYQEKNLQEKAINSNWNLTIKEIKEKTDKIKNEKSEIKEKVLKYKSLFNFEIKDFVLLLKTNLKSVGVEVWSFPDEKETVYKDNDFYSTGDRIERQLVWKLRFPKQKINDFELLTCADTLDNDLGEINCDFSKFLFNNKVPYKEIFTKTIFELATNKCKEIARKKQDNYAKEITLLKKKYRELTNKKLLEQNINNLKENLKTLKQEQNALNNVDNVEIEEKL